MAASDGLFRVGAISQSARGAHKPTTLLAAARHNRRAIAAEGYAGGSVDPSLSHSNVTLAGPDTPEGVVALADDLMAAGGVRRAALRKDHVQAVELIFSLPPDRTADGLAFFERCAAWAMAHYAGCAMLSADVHHDEAAPHCHVLLLPPVADGRMRGSAMLGRAHTARAVDAFFREVAPAFGLRRPPPRLAGKLKAGAVAAVIEAIKAGHGEVFRSPLWAAVRQAIESQPEPWLAELGLEAPRRALRTMAQVFTSAGKGAKRRAPEPEPAKPIGFAAPTGHDEPCAGTTAKPIGFRRAQRAPLPQDRNLSCVGFARASTAHAQPPAPVPTLANEVPSAPTAWTREPADVVPWAPVGDDEWPPPSRPPPDLLAGDGRRVRDAELPAGQWDEELGEFVGAV